MTGMSLMSHAQTPSSPWPMAIATASPGSEPRPGPRRIGLWADDRSAALDWQDGLAAEGLLVEWGDAAPGQLDAQVLWIGGGLAAQLPVLRAHHAAAPMRPLLVACRGLRDLDQILALEMGADDVIDARIGAPVVAARLRALWRRRQQHLASELSPQELQFGALRLLARERRVLLEDRELPLSEGEFEVLWLLASHAGRALSRREILQRVRGLDDHPTDRSIDSRVYRIRAKLGDTGGGPQRIRTVRHHGYAFSPQGW
jgi:DNA-binding response OmpR family regulator